ncbi:MAG: imidazole glycerol phosphate synthase subunit HisH [Helicobacteraceae bacterium]|nr:imidazole glycerol phosphate synthase subunit HisH [Helicobacteraceae bacterium]
MIGIVDYKMGNLASLLNSLNKIGAEAKIVKEPSELALCDRAALPGVGAFGDAADHLKQSGMDKAIKEFAQSGKPLLGVCLGLQLLFERSEESPNALGLGLLKGTIRRFDPLKAAHSIKIPHMGWNKTLFTRPSPLFSGLESGVRLYFVHGYHVVCDESVVIARAFYGYEFVCAIESGNIFAIQPHPEKSHDAGLRVLTNFAAT